LGIASGQSDEGAKYAGPAPVRAFDNPQSEKVAQLAYEAIRKLSRSPGVVPDISYISRPEVQAQIVREVQSQYRPQQMELEGVAPPPPDFGQITAQVATLYVDRTINIPRISVMPKGEVKAGFKPFTLDLSNMNYVAPDSSLLAKYLNRNEVQTIGVIQANLYEETPEDYVVSGLINFPDVSYDDNSELLYDLARQVVEHLQPRMSREELMALLQSEQEPIARAVHAQMLDHFWTDDTVEYQHVVTSGFTEIRQSAHSAERGEPLDFSISPADKSKMTQYLFGGFTKCLTNVARFQSDSERKLAVILEREADKWFRPAKGQFQMFYRKGNDPQEYQPDFVAETEGEILMLEPKMATQMGDVDVLAKRDVAVQWCQWASEHAKLSGGKPWRYALIPHDQIADNMGLDFMMQRFGC
jgi:type III restriction enzyme